MSLAFACFVEYTTDSYGLELIACGMLCPATNITTDPNPISTRMPLMKIIRPKRPKAWPEVFGHWMLFQFVGCRPIYRRREHSYHTGRLSVLSVMTKMYIIDTSWNELLPKFYSITEALSSGNTHPFILKLILSISRGHLAHAKQGRADGWFGV